MKSRLLLQLYNASSRTSQISADGSEAPNHLQKEYVLKTHGFEVKTIPLSGRILNPFHRLHNAYRGLDPIRALRVFIFYQRAFCICAHMESLLLIILLRSLFRFRPTVIVWEVPWSPGWRYREIVSRIVLAKADLCVVFSRNQIELVKSQFGSQIRCYFIPFCVDVEFFKPGISSDSDYIFSTGRDIGRDFGLVIDIAKVFTIPIKIRADINFRSDYANVEIISEFVSFTDYRRLYQNATIVIIACHVGPNASGVTSLLEAMSMAKPVIVTETPSLRDYLPPPGSGVIIQPGDAQALQAAVKQLLDNPEAARQMGLRARAFVLRQFSPERHFEQYSEMLESCSPRTTNGLSKRVI